MIARGGHGSIRGKLVSLILAYKLSFLLLFAVSARAANFLWLSDIHFDPLADHALVDKLATAEPTEWADILSAGSSSFSTYGRDTNWPLFASALQASGRNIPKPAFTIVTGDLLVHHFREQFNAAATVHDDAAFGTFVRKTFEFVTLQLKRNSQGAPVFVALGNNDDECGDYALQPDGPFLRDTAPVVSSLAGLTNADSYIQYGSYSIANPVIRRHRIIVLNTVAFSSRYINRCAASRNTDPGEQLLTWLATELQSAKSHHEKVWLVYHIPPGVDAFATTHAKQPGTVALLWKEAYTTKFLALLQQYQGVVGPNFAGHIHVDDFRLLGSTLKSSPFVIVAPALSPITGQNPTFRTVTFDAHGTLKDFSTYYLQNLTEISKETAPVWQLEYDFDKEWRANSVNAETLFKLFTSVSDDTNAAARWTTLYSTSHAGSSITPTTFQQFHCAAGGVSAQEFESCVARKGLVK